LYVNGLTWAKAHNLAVGAKRETFTFNVSTIFGHSSMYALGDDEPPPRDTFNVEAAPLDEILGADAKLDVAKIDVEGAELDVLKGMAGLLKTNRDIALVAEFGPTHLVRVGVTPEAWFAAFAAEGFVPYVIAEPGGATTLTSASALAKVESANVAFVRPGGQAAARLKG
jgi:FkbM family methyltransferase